jgi:hypothetical protein
MALLSSTDIPISVPFGSVKLSGKLCRHGQLISDKFTSRKKAFIFSHWEIQWTGKLYGPGNLK